MRGQNEIRFALLGMGYWGPNYLRLLTNCERAAVKIVCDKDPSRFDARNIKRSGALTSADEDETIHSDTDAVVICTPASTHYALCKKALENGKHVLVEKPMALTLNQASELFRIARERKLVLMSGLVYLYNSAVTLMKQHLKRKRIIHISSIRTALGPIRSDVGAIFDLAVHDFAIMSYLTDDFPSEVWCMGANLLADVEDLAVSWLRFSNCVGSAKVSWIDPLKRREVAVVTQDEMILFDDTNGSAPIQIYENSIQSTESVSDFGQFRYHVKNGRVVMPYVEYSEPLSKQLNRFLDRIQAHQIPLTWEDEIGLKTTAIAAAAKASMKMKGKAQSLETPHLIEEIRSNR